jgi:hypothetical protein
MNSLLNSASSPSSSSSVTATKINLLGALVQYTSKILFTDKTKLELASHVGASRSILARAILTIACASLKCLIFYEKASESTKRACISALEKTVLFSKEEEKEAEEGTESNQPERDLLEWRHLNAAAGLELTKSDQALLNFLQTSSLENDKETSTSALTPTPTTPTKRKTRRKSSSLAPSKITTTTTSKLSDFYPLLESFVSQDTFQNHRIDARVALKRWAAMTLEWNGRGQWHLLECVHTIASDKGIPTHTTKSEWMTTLVNIVCEVGAQGGLRPPTGGMDLYAKAILASSTPSTKKLSKKKAKLGRTDIRDPTVIVIYDMLQLHREVLQQQTNPSASGAFLINLDPETDQETTKTTTVNKNLSTTLSKLCRAAAASVPNSTYHEQAHYGQSLMGLGVALSFRLCQDTELPLDVALTNSALKHLSDTLKRLESNSVSAVDSSTPQDSSLSSSSSLEALFKLKQPLPAPSKTNKLDPNSKCTYAGMGDNLMFLNNDESNKDEIDLALVLRALGGNNPASRLVSVLTTIVERMYDTRSSTNDIVEEEDDKKSKSKTTKKKRSSSSSPNRRSKRRKVFKDDDEEKEIDQGWEYQRITSQRALLAAEALQTLKWCFEVQTYPQSALRQSIRESCSLKNYTKVMELGNLLDKILVKTREPIRFPEESEDEGDDEADEDDDRSVICEFAHYENILFTSHITMCQVLGRSSLSSNDTGTHFLTHPILGNYNQRKSLYINLVKASSGTLLCLPAAHQALLLANLTSERIPAARVFCVPELYLVKEYAKSIISTLHSILPLTKNKKERLPNFSYLDDNIALSYHDACVFTISFCRLMKEDQQTILEDLITSVLEKLTEVRSTPQRLDSLRTGRDASGFVARLLITIGACLDITTVGTRIDKLYYSLPTTVGLPAFSSLEDWYRKSRHFMSIVNSNWESCKMPFGISIPTSLNGLKKKTLEEYGQVLELAFAMGLETAQTDKCHLLFASWNSLDKIHSLARDTIRGSPRSGAFPSLSVCVNKENVVMRLLELKEDVCTIYTNDNNRYESSNRFKSKLKSMITKADSLIHNIVTKSNDIEDSVALVALLSSLPTYISASIAAHTKPGNDYFSSFLNSSASYRSGDESNDAEGFQEAGRETSLSRLRECCHAFGAAPMHPDWLDLSCSLKEGIRYVDAKDNAQDALSMLSQIITFAFERYQKYAIKALQGYCQGKKKEEDLEAALNLCQFTHDEACPYPDDRSWSQDLATAFDIPQEAIDLFVEDRSENIEQVREAWLSHASSRLKGQLQSRNRLDGVWDTSVAELRAGGEWELLLAEALSVCCITVQSSSTIVGEEEANSDAILALQWLSVMQTATSHLLPASALFRLCLAKVGRNPHPFGRYGIDFYPDPYDSAPLVVTETVPTISTSGKSVIFETLALLSRLSVPGDQLLSGTCHAVACHLLEDTEHFVHLESIHLLRFAFSGTDFLLKSITKKKTNQAVSFLVQRLMGLLSVYSKDDATHLLTFLGSPGGETCTMHTLVGRGERAFAILEKSCLAEEKHRWTSQYPHVSAIHQLVFILTSSSSSSTPIISDTTKGTVAKLLVQVCSLDLTSSGNIISAMIQAFNGVSESQLKLFIGDFLYSDRCEDLACILNLLLAVDGLFQRSKLVLTVLLDEFDSWLASPSKSSKGHVLETLVLYGCRFNALLEIGSRVVGYVSNVADDNMEVDVEESDEQNSRQDQDVQLITDLFGFIRDLKNALSKTACQDQAAVALESMKIDTTKVSKEQKFGAVSSSSLDGINILPRSCSYVQKSGFHDQHWYNCYTCGLVWDKGCCTLCALVCHKGHDVSYSRCSSFFCDCGAEHNSATEESRVFCKCLTPLSKDRALEILQSDGYEDYNETSDEVESSFQKKEFDSVSISCPSDFMSIEIVRKGFRMVALSSITTFTDNAKQSPWLESLFKLLEVKFQAWKLGHKSSDLLSSFLPSDDYQSRSKEEKKPSFRLSHLFQREELRQRKQKSLILLPMKKRSLIPVRSIKGFQRKLSSNNSANSHLLSRLARHERSRSMIAIDSRGRMIVAEPCVLLFTSAIPAVSTRYISPAITSRTSLTRQQMCLLGKSSTRFNVVGMSLNCENENHLVVWGTSEACVCVLKPDWTGIQEMIDLVFDISSSDCDGSDYLVKCEWIPNSQTHVAVGCSRFVRIYDMTRGASSSTPSSIKNEDTKKTLPVVGYNLGFEACLRDVTIVPFRSFEMSNNNYFDTLEGQVAFNISKMFLLLENGRLHVVDLKTSPEGKLESPGEQQHFEPSECVSLNMGGVRLRSGCVGHPGSSTRTLGEGSCLAYLKQSRVLLYKCSSSCVLALLLDRNGDVEGSFELLPHIISAEALDGSCTHPSTTEASSSTNVISGPYTHWTELGIAHRENGTAYFRVACVGRSMKSNQPKLLLVEFNVAEVRIRELLWTLGQGLIRSVEGLAAFSAPFLQTLGDDGGHYGERVFLSVIASNGSMMFFGDEVVDTLPISSSSEINVLQSTMAPIKFVNLSSDNSIVSSPPKKPVFPLILFERLKNLSDSDSINFGGHGLGRYVLFGFIGCNFHRIFKLS